MSGNTILFSFKYVSNVDPNTDPFIAYVLPLEGNFTKILTCGAIATLSSLSYSLAVCNVNNDCGEISCKLIDAFPTISSLTKLLFISYVSCIFLL